VWYYNANEIAESTIFLKTDNIKLVNSYDYFSPQNDPRTACYFEKENKTLVLSNYSVGRTIQYSDGKIILKESDDYDFLVRLEYLRARGLYINIDVERKFRDESYFSFYRIHKDVSKDKPVEIRTEYLGSIHTNMYGAWYAKGSSSRISISPDGKYIVMNAGAVNSRSLGKFRNKGVLLVWEIGDNVLEKDIVDSTGKKIPIIIKTEEELEKE